VLHPVQVLPDSDLSGPRPQPGSSARYFRVSYSRTAQLDLVNPLRSARAVRVTIGVTSLRGATRFEVATPDGGRAVFAARPTASGGGAVTLRPGHNRLRLTAFMPQQRFETEYFSIDRVIVEDQTVQQILSRAE
jgi:hypothetical protein